MHLLYCLLLKLLGETFVLTGYITSPNTFPDPLDAEEEKKFIDMAAEGDLDARNKLIETNLRLVAHVVKKFVNTGCENEDLVSIGTIGLIKAVESYKNNKGTKLATYAAKCIENEILMHIRSRKKLNNEVHLDNPIGTDKEGNEITLMDVIPDNNDEISELLEFRMQVKKIYDRLGKVLTDRENEIIRLRYGLYRCECLTQREIADKLGISRSYVSRIEKKALQKLKGELGKK
ncbi:MAG TPA: RNA polymerase sporulation sigma factor SigK [Clostridiales bacterium]|nr:RNA polymerase sporulation sigma factor SigK [Clostridiales bacterium]